MKCFFWNRHTQLILKHLMGWFCIVVGLIMLITPGQGLLTILIGIYLLADEIPLFARIKTYIEIRFPKTADFVHRKKEQLKAKLHRSRGK